MSTGIPQGDEHARSKYSDLNQVHAKTGRIADYSGFPERQNAGSHAIVCLFDGVIDALQDALKRLVFDGSYFGLERCGAE